MSRNVSFTSLDLNASLCFKISSYYHDQSTFLIMATIWELYQNFIDTPEVNDWSILRYGLFILPISTIIYLLLTAIVGPRIMRNKKPLKFKNFLYFYNSVGCISNGSLIIYLIVITKLFTSLRLFREDVVPCLYANIVASAAIFIIIRLFDYLDTLLIILRKKTSQLPLNIVHHAIAPNSFFFTFFLFIKSPYLVYIITTNCVCHLIVHLYFIVYLIKLKSLANAFRKLMLMTQVLEMLVYITFTLYYSSTFGISLYLEIIFLFPQFVLLFFFFQTFWKLTFKKRTKMIGKSSS